MSLPLSNHLRPADEKESRKPRRVVPAINSGSASDDAIASLLIGRSPAMQRVHWLVLKLARTPLPVLIHGPTGAGKELVARALHAASERHGAFVACNVCAIADGLFESAVFGHVRGGFTGAVADNPGILLEAHAGTVFLDEIGGLGLSAQAKLLRAIENRQFRPVGGKVERRSDFRVVAATNEDLCAQANSGQFRSDLLYRLGGVVIEVPSLSERREDVPLLVGHFLGERSIARAAMHHLVAQDWPGNVRELRSVVECAAALAGKEEELTLDLVVEALNLRATARAVVSATGNASRVSRSRSNQRVASVLLEVLSSCNGDIDATAAILGIHRATVYRRLSRLRESSLSRFEGSESEV